MREPFNLTLKEIGELTPYQVQTLYLCEMEEDGTPKLSEEDFDLKNPMERFLDQWKGKGLTADEAMKLWEEHDGPVQSQMQNSIRNLIPSDSEN